MAKTFLISTVAVGTVTLNDLGARAFTHPVASLDLALEYSLEEIRDSDDLRQAIEDGDLTAVFDGESITTAVLFDKFVVDFNNVMVEDHETRIDTLENNPPVIRKSFTYSAGEDGKLNGSRDLRRTSGIPTNITPFVVPIASTIWGISIASEQRVNKSFQVQVLVNGSALITKTITNTDKLFSNTETQALLAGDEVRIRFIKTTDNIDDLGIELYCVES